jgi:hypothetical protein
VVDPVEQQRQPLVVMADQLHEKNDELMKGVISS